MGTAEERIAAVEARVGEHSVMMEAIRQSIDRLDQRVTTMDNRIDQRFTALEARLDQRFAAIDQKFAALDRRFSAIDQRFTSVDQRFTGVDGRFESLDAKMSRHFQWLMGGIFGGVATILVAIFSRS